MNLNVNLKNMFLHNHDVMKAIARADMQLHVSRRAAIHGVSGQLFLFMD
jgi:hypothetical protein